MDERTMLGLASRKESIEEQFRDCVSDLFYDLESVRDGILSLEHLGYRLLYGSRCSSASADDTAA